MCFSLPDWTYLSLPEQIGQMVVVRASGYLFDHQILYPVWEPPVAKLRHWLQTLNLGGVILLGGSAAELALRSQQLQSWATTPLLIAADIEEGVGQRFSGATWFPPPMALNAIATKNLALDNQGMVETDVETRREGDAEKIFAKTEKIIPQISNAKNLAQAQYYATQMGTITAQEALAIGINWILAPIVDVNNNPHNPVINIRAFADTPELVSHLATAFIQGAKEYPVLTTAKHFPGHGDTATDSHLDLPVLSHSTSRLAEVELPPFQSAIASGVDTVMTAHLLIPAWDSDRPATLSQPILTGQLRQKLGFEGLIVTDALIMGGVAKYDTPEELAVMAIEAGADILLMPPDPEVAISAIYKAVQSGRLTEERIAQSVERIWKAKQKIGLVATEGSVRGVGRVGAQGLRPQNVVNVGEKRREENLFQNSEFILENLAFLSQPASMKTVEAILRDSMEIGGYLPLKPLKNKKGRNLIVVDDLLKCDFLNRHTPSVVIPHQFGYEVQLLDQNTLIHGQIDDRITLLQVFIRGNPFRGSAGLTSTAQDFYQKLLHSDLVQGLIVYGSPYVWQWFCEQINPELSRIFSYGQMPIAQAIACQALLDLSKSPDTKAEDFL